MSRQRSAARAAAIGLKIVSRTYLPTSKRSRVMSVGTSSEPSLPFLLPLNTPVLQRVVEHLRAMTVDQVGLVEIVANSIVKGRL
jgi:hypothetical protein